MSNKIENIEHAKVHKLRELISSNAGEVVSKTLANTDGANVSLFSFQKGEGLSPHTAPGDAMVYAIEGICEITIDGESNIINAGETIIMPANVTHALKAETNFKMLLVLIK